MPENSFDVVVIGAGAAGLIAALELALTGKRVAIAEARAWVGGRTHTIQDPLFELPVELGAEFVHGDLELTQRILKKAGIASYKVSGEIWQSQNGGLQEQKDFVEDYSTLNKKFKQLDHDISVAEFMEQYLQEEGLEDLRFSLKSYVEGYYAANTRKASTYSLRDELSGSDAVQYRIEEGYVKLIDYLAEQCRQKSVAFFLSCPVREINWQNNKVKIIGTTVLQARKVLVTVPVGVLQTEKIRFTPALPLKMVAARQLGFGPAIKTMLQFDTAFWKEKKYTGQKDLTKLGFMFSSATVPTWWTYYPKKSAMITGWSGGPHAEELKDLRDEEILQKALGSLSKIFSIDVSALNQKLKAWHVANWVSDPFFCGGYSYEVVGGAEARRIVREPVEQTLFFAGEGLYDGTEIGTVEAALLTGKETAYQVVASFKS